MCNVHSKCASQWSGQCFYQSSKYILRPASELETRSNDLRFSSSLASFCFYIGLAITQDSQSLFEFKFIFVLQGLQCHMYFLFFFREADIFLIHYSSKILRLEKNWSTGYSSILDTRSRNTYCISANSFCGNYSFLKVKKCGNFHIVSALWQFFTS